MRPATVPLQRVFKALRAFMVKGGPTRKEPFVESWPVDRSTWTQSEVHALEDEIARERKVIEVQADEIARLRAKAASATTFRRIVWTRMH